MDNIIHLLYVNNVFTSQSKVCFQRDKILTHTQIEKDLFDESIFNYASKLCLVGSRS